MSKKSKKLDKVSGGMDVNFDGHLQAHHLAIRDRTGTTVTLIDDQEIDRQRYN